MDALTIFGALAASEGANAMAILAPTELPPGHVSWTTKDISAADRTFASTEPASPIQTWLAAGACLVAWKEATFEGMKSEEELKKKPGTEEPS
jgi:hypothetical protein